MLLVHLCTLWSVADIRREQRTTTIFYLVVQNQLSHIRGARSVRQKHMARLDSVDGELPLDARRQR